MPAIKVGVASVAAFVLSCPVCKDPVRCPSTGSFLIGSDSLHSWARSQRLEVDVVKFVPCSECGARFRLPRAVLALT